jgi:succinoglycan biosynthesis transport protein ExoP
MDAYADEERGSGGGFDPKFIWRIFWRRKWLFLIPFVLCSILTFVVIDQMTPIYFSSGQVRVVYEATSIRSLPSESRYGGRNFDREAFVNIQTIVTGPKFLEKVVRELNLHRTVEVAGAEPAADLPASDENLDRRVEYLAARLSDQIRVDQDGTHLFRIGVRDTDPQRAYLLARFLLERFLEEERATRMLPSTTTMQFLETQRDSQAVHLADAERRLTEFQRSMLSASLAGNPINERNLSQAEIALGRLRNQHQDVDANELYAREREARPVLGNLPSVTGYAQNAEISNTMRELAGLEFEEVIVPLTGTGRGADFQNNTGVLRLRMNTLVEAKVARDYPQLAASDRFRLSQYIYQRLYRDVRQQVINRLQDNIREFRDFTTRQPEQSVILAGLQREVETARTRLQSIESDIAEEEMRLEASLSEIGYKMVVRRDPKLPSRPIEPNKTKLGFMGVVFALAVGAGLVVLAVLLDRSFSSVEDIERTLRVKVIGTLPVVDSDFFGREEARRIWIWITLAVLVAAATLVVVYLIPRWR